MKFINVKSKGQTFVEFLLVFVVLLVATTGVFAMYKKVWRYKYNKTKAISEIVPTTSEGIAVKLRYGEYVK